MRSKLLIILLTCMGTTIALKVSPSLFNCTSIGSAINCTGNFSSDTMNEYIITEELFDCSHPNANVYFCNSDTVEYLVHCHINQRDCTLNKNIPMRTITKILESPDMMQILYIEPGACKSFICDEDHYFFGLYNEYHCLWVGCEEPEYVDCYNWSWFTHTTHCLVKYYHQYNV